MFAKLHTLLCHLRKKNVKDAFKNPKLKDTNSKSTFNINTTVVGFGQGEYVCSNN